MRHRTYMRCLANQPPRTRHTSLEPGAKMGWHASQAAEEKKLPSLRRHQEAIREEFQELDYDDVGWVGDEVAEVAQAAKEQVVNQWRKCRASARQGQRQLLKTDHAPASKGCSKARRKANNERRRWLASLPGNPESLGDEQVASVKRHAAVAFAHAVEKLGTAARALTRVLQAEAVAKRATTDVDPSKRMVRNRVS